MLTLRSAGYDLDQMTATVDAVEEAMYWLIQTGKNEGVAYRDFELLRKYAVDAQKRLATQKARGRRRRKPKLSIE